MNIAEQLEKVDETLTAPNATQPGRAGEIEYDSWLAPSAGELEYRSWLAAHTSGSSTSA